ncbi:hypothetical protein [Paenibacillus sp. YPG26]|uniref:hypothetical protein n=1 Tax=Paenibacillus sp. YPG26 TaxID=2878915 RepID=UPI003209508F
MTKYIKLLGLILGVIGLNIIVLSPGFIGLEIGGSALSTALGVTLLVGSALGLFYGSYTLLFSQPAPLPVPQIKTHDDYVEAISHFRRVRPLLADINLTLEQMERIRKKKAMIFNVLAQRFDQEELSFKKFASVTNEVEKLFFLNIRSILNRLHVFDESEFERVMSQKGAKFSPELLKEKMHVYNDFLIFMQDSLETNEEIILKLDKLLLEISRLDSIDSGDIENMPCMQEIDSLIKQTKYYKQ